MKATQIMVIGAIIMALSAWLLGNLSVKMTAGEFIVFMVLIIGTMAYGYSFGKMLNEVKK